jgi:hypothetical protein
LVLAGAAGLKAQTNPLYDATAGIKLVDQNFRDAAERERAFQASVSSATFDVNHDGKLDETEFAAWTKRVRPILENNAKFMKKFDLNHDRTLDDAEWTAAWSAGFDANAPGKPEKKSG